MASVGTLWGLSTQRQSRVIMAVAAVAGLKLDVPPMELKVTNKTPEFLSKFPMGKIPAFEGSDGLKLFEGATIARYVSSLAPESGLLGKDASETALIDQWVHLGESEISQLSNQIIGLVLGRLGPYSKQLHDVILTRQGMALKVLDEHLARSASGYLISDAMTLADIAVAAVSEQAGQITCGAEERALYPHVFAHYEKVTSHPKMKEIFREPNFVEKGWAYKAETA